MYHVIGIHKTCPAFAGFTYPGGNSRRRFLLGRGLDGGYSGEVGLPLSFQVGDGLIVFLHHGH